MIEIRSGDMEDAPELLTDVEVTTYPIRITQILFTVWSKYPNKLKPTIEKVALDNPWVVWASESVDNYELLWNYGMDILDEHACKFGETAKHPYKHGSTTFMEELGVIPPLPAVGLTAHPGK